MYLICTYIILFFIYSFLGWLLEVTCKFIQDKKFVNRGFLIGPYCPIYGYGSLFITIVLDRYLNDPVTLFIMIVLSFSILEYFTSFFLEKIYNTRWWDYSNRRFNINGRICLETMIPFGFFGLLIMYVLSPCFLNLINMIPTIILYILTVILLIAYIIDNILSSKIIKNIQNVSRNIQRKQIIKRDDTERITKLVKKQIEQNKQVWEQRILKSFPHLQILKEKRKRKS